MVQVVELLQSKYKALSSNPSTIKKEGKKKKKSTHWAKWLTPVILATQKAAIRRIAVQSQPGQIVSQTLF
jgi:hypothetical protein